MAKRLPSDTATAAIAAMTNAAKPLPNPPKHVRIRAKDAPFWVNIVSSRLRDDWSEADLIVAAQLARAQADIEAQQTLLDDEGFVIMNNREDGNPIPNPRAQIVEQLTRRSQLLSRSLRLGAGGAPMETARKLQRQSTALRNEVAREGRGLLAT